MYAGRKGLFFAYYKNTFKTVLKSTQDLVDGFLFTLSKDILLWMLLVLFCGHPIKINEYAVKYHCDD